jgi:hypothetical protein
MKMLMERTNMVGGEDKDHGGEDEGVRRLLFCDGGCGAGGWRVAVDWYVQIEREKRGNKFNKLPSFSLKYQLCH